MEPVALAAAALIVLGAPALAATLSLRANFPKTDTVELVAIGYGGIAIAVLALWVSSQVFGSSWLVVFLASVTGTAVVGLPFLLLARSRVHGGDSAEGTAPLTGHHDGRVVPGAVAAARGGMLGLPAPERNAHFGVLAAAGVGFALLCYVPFLTFGLQRADGIHRMAMTDWYKHLMAATALTSADAFPPPNPFLHAADSAPYYYGFHLLASSMARLGGALSGLSGGGSLIYAALLALTLITAMATPFVAYVAARSIVGVGGRRSGATGVVPLLASLGATFMAGFDLVPLAIDTIMNLLVGGPLRGGLTGLRAAIPSTHLDYWIHHNERQFNAPFLTTIWAPQHMAAVLVALLVVHLVLRRAAETERRVASGPTSKSWLLPALLLAGLPALSAYVALALAVGVAGAVVLESLGCRRAPWRTDAWSLWRAPAVAATFLALPIAAVLATGSAAGLVFHVSAAGGWVNGALLSSLFGPVQLINILDTIPVYLVEFGILGLLAAVEVFRLRNRDRLQGRQAHVVRLVAAIVLLVTFVRPPVGGPNNLYARPLVLVWFLLAPFAATRFGRLTGLVARAATAAGDARAAKSHVASSGDRKTGRLAIAASLVCLLATGYALVGVVLEGAFFWAAPAGTVRTAVWVNANTPAGSVVAVHPDEFHSSLGYWLRRPLVLADERHALLFGGTRELYERTARAEQAAFEAARADLAAAGFDALGATHVMVGRSVAARAGWLDSPCFEVVHRGEAWLVAARTAASCDTGGS